MKTLAKPPSLLTQSQRNKEIEMMTVMFRAVSVGDEASTDERGFFVISLYST